MTRDDLTMTLNEWVRLCEGAVMSSNGGKPLHNFAFEIQTQIQYLISELEYEGIEADEKTND